VDIFTTALTRVVPVPIKPATSKVKALQKSAATSAVSDDAIDDEKHELPVKKNNSDKGVEREAARDNSSADTPDSSKDSEDKSAQHIDMFEDSEITTSEEDGKPHLDIFI